MSGPSDGGAVLQTLGERVRTLRARRGMTRRVLSERSGVSQRYLAQLEAGEGNVSVLLLHALARALGVAPGALLDAAPEKPPELAAAQRVLERLDAVHLAEARALIGARFGSVGVGSVGVGRAGRIALIGLRGAGKSTLGARLAAACGTGFTELDRAIEQEAGIELPAILELHGQAAFRRFERAALDRWLAATNAGVLAAGGSIVAEPETYARLLEGCRTVWLRTSAAEHMARVAAQGDLRPMRGNPRAMADLHAILSSREALYARADLVLDTSGASVAESLGALRRLLGENGASA